MSQNVGNILSHQVRDTIDRWLSYPKSSGDYNAAIRQRHEGTGGWFLKSDNFENWKTRRNSVLWLQGITGCGKTVLSSIIIENLKKDSACQLLYFYFKDTDVDESLRKMLCSLVSQLYCLSEEAANQLESLYSDCGNGKEQPTLKSLRNVFLSMTEKIGEAWLVLDALDESGRGSDSKERQELLLWIQNIATNSDRRNIHLLVTSRPEADIKSAIASLAAETDIIFLGNHLIGDDINKYIGSRVCARDPCFKKWKSRPEILKKIQTVVTEKANGMFRLAACQIDILQQCCDPPDLLNNLDKLPTTLEEIYSKMLNKIPSIYQHKAIRILQFLSYSSKPLRVNEVVDILAVDTDGQGYFNSKDRMPNPVDILCYCPGLVVIGSPRYRLYSRDDRDYDDQRLELAHLSVKEYVISGKLGTAGPMIAQGLQESHARASMAKVCYAYLLSVQLDHLTQRYEDVGDWVFQKNFPFTMFAIDYCTNLGFMAAAEDDTVWDYSRRFLDKFHQAASHGILYGSHTYYSALAYASRNGQKREVDYLLGHYANIDEKDLKRQCKEALESASKGGYYEIAELLLNNGTDFDWGDALIIASAGDHRDNDKGSLESKHILLGAIRNHYKFVRVLLEKRDSYHIEKKVWQVALERALNEGHDDIVELLLDNGTNFSASEDALYCVSQKRRYDVVQRLLHHGIDANGGKAAILIASSNGYYDIVELLLNNGADVNAGGGGALIEAVRYGHRDIVELLLNNGADVNASRGDALVEAVRKGHRDIVELLLNNGADVNASRGDALVEAVRKGHRDIVELFLNNGADVNAGEGGALVEAAKEGYYNIVELFLNNDADVNAGGGGALINAAKKGYYDIVELLLNNSADVNAGRSGALVEAAKGKRYNDMKQWPNIYNNVDPKVVGDGYRDIVELLLDHGADINACGGDALVEAAKIRHRDIVELFLKKGVDVTLGGERGCVVAAEEGYYEIVKLLLDYGVNIQVVGYASIFKATLHGHYDIVKLLLTRGANKHRDVSHLAELAIREFLLKRRGVHYDIATLLREFPYEPCDIPSCLVCE
ncbi:hypothetical protein TWF730_008235 [Orbilia blumenaviensis]|uniref:NACHT domain-containing protein n=1 Tax=Orbilia blumenaviensis TaxID=1796055 RepID=A0AAV9V1W6_9PEZI